MPSSNDTRVRVDGFSKMRASALPASGFSLPPGTVPRLYATPTSRMRRRTVGSMRSRSRKWRISAAARPISSRPVGGFGPPAADLVENRQRAIDMALVDDERRQDANDVCAPADGEQPGCTQPVHHLGVRRHALDPEHQPGPADIDQHARMPLHQRLETGAQYAAYALDIGQETVGEQDIEHGVAAAHGQRTAAEGAAGAAGGARTGRLSLGEACTDGEAAADAGCRGNDVRLDAGPLVREEPAGAAHAALHLVAEQQQAEFIRNRAQGLQVVRRRRAHTAL